MWTELIGGGCTTTNARTFANEEVVPREDVGLVGTTVDGGGGSSGSASLSIK